MLFPIIFPGSRGFLIPKFPLYQQHIPFLFPLLLSILGRLLYLGNEAEKDCSATLRATSRVAHIYVTKLAWHPKQVCIQSGHWENLQGMDATNINY